LRQHQAWAWLYAVNVYLSIKGDWALSYIQHFWSLAVEEHFYFVWPFVVWLLGRRPGALMRVALAVAAASFLGRVVASVAGVSLVVTTVFTPFQLDALLLGGFFALHLRQPGGEAGVRRMMLPMTALGLAILVLQFGVHQFTEAGLAFFRSLRVGAFHLLFGVLLLKAILAPPSSPLSRFFCSGPMVMLGKYSYGLYVYHHFISHFFAKHATEFVVAQAVGSHSLAIAIQASIGMTLSMAAAWVSYEFFEKHFLALKRFWPSSRGSLQ
jgi:peptidoglycan/LPS O-acetylase OafA/YrhL